MTQNNKTMDYKEKLKLAEDLYNKVRLLSSGEARETVLTLEQIFPELRESEDEKIRKWLIRLISTNMYTELDTDPMPYSRTKTLSWLEKQKPVEWSEEDDKIRECLIASLAKLSANTRTDSTSLNYTFSREIEWIKSLKPQRHWKPSEEQMTNLETAIRYYKSGKIKLIGNSLESLYEDLKKL